MCGCMCMCVCECVLHHITVMIIKGRVMCGKMQGRRSVYAYHINTLHTIFDRVYTNDIFVQKMLANFLAGIGVFLLSCPPPVRILVIVSDVPCPPPSSRMDSSDSYDCYIVHAYICLYTTLTHTHTHAHIHISHKSGHTLLQSPLQPPSPHQALLAHVFRFKPRKGPFRSMVVMIQTLVLLQAAGPTH